MREIKFRAWDKNNNKMLIDTNLMFPAISLSGNIIAYRGDEQMHNTKHLLLMQYTGLKDKNGVEIYEGDVMSDEMGEDSEVGKVVFVDGAFRLETDDTLFEPEEVATFNVIGNVYNNPELLTNIKEK